MPESTAESTVLQVGYGGWWDGGMVGWWDGGMVGGAIGDVLKATQHRTVILVITPLFCNV